MIYVYATREQAEIAGAQLRKEGSFVDAVIDLKYGPGPPGLYNGMHYRVSYVGANEPMTALPATKG